MPLAGPTGFASALAAALLVSLPPADPSPAERSKPAPGRFLVATRQVTGPFFARTVVLLIEYGENGALGVIVNRPTPLALAEILPHFESLRGRADPVYMGGPVESGSMLVLVRSGKPPPESSHVVGDLHVSSSAVALRQILETDPSPPFRAYLGYAGWAPGQLDNELQRGDWRVTPAREELVFDEDPSGVWEQLIREHGGVEVRAPRLRTTDPWYRVVASPQRERRKEREWRSPSGRDWRKPGAGFRASGRRTARGPSWPSSRPSSPAPSG